MVFHRQLATFDGIVMLAAAGILTLAVWINGLGRLEGLGFLIMVFFYTYYTIQYEKKRGRESASARGNEVTKKTSWIIDSLYIALSLIVLFVAARGFLYGAVGIARSMAISEAVIGLTLVAVGTSLPEFATSTLAAWRGKSDIAIGNIVGSNIYNILGILGIVGLVAPLKESNIHFSDFMAMVGFTLAFYVLIWRGKKAGRLTGALLFGVYLVYVIALYER
jgi:cation:H+ antiporter